ncbi:MAG: DUF3048 domain-containing protein [Clostridia bacterium]|nr:DUF3048 domain-containing protein [Clostridia bacterium]
MKRKKTKNLTRILAAVLLSVLVLTAVSCDNGEVPIIDPGTTAPQTENVPPNSTVPDDTSAEPEDTTEKKPADSSSEPEITSSPLPESSSGPAETYIDPLTGLRTERDLTYVRPVSLVLDNVSAAAPQSGISRSDILIECMVESGISRLIMFTNDYGEANEEGGLEVYGPIRSTRHYMVSLSQSVKSLMVGAGYSDQGYGAIKNGGYDYIDGVHDRYALSGFFRDNARIREKGYEHSLMITGKGIEKLAAIYKYPTTNSSATPMAFNFVTEGKEVVLTSGAAYHTILRYSSYQEVQLIYSSLTGTYYRYQFGDKAHLDAENGEQLNFKNVFVLFAKQEKLEGDTEGRLDVGVTGGGSGYYISGGRYAVINWSRAGEDKPFEFMTPEGLPLSINRGTTFISVVSDSLKGTSSIELNYALH